MNAALPPFKNGEHNSEIVSTIDHVITLLINHHFTLQLYQNIHQYSEHVRIDIQLHVLLDYDNLWSMH